MFEGRRGRSRHGRDFEFRMEAEPEEKGRNAVVTAAG